MPNTSISGLSSGAPALVTDALPIARSGANFKLTVADIIGIPAAASWQFANWIPSDVAGTETAPSDTPTAQLTATTYMTMASASGVLTFTFTKAGNYLVNFSGLMSGAAAATTQYLRLIVGGSATRYWTPTSTMYASGPTATTATFSLPLSILVAATASQTITLAPKISITQGAGTASNYTASAAASALYVGGP